MSFYISLVGLILILTIVGTIFLYFSSTAKYGKSKQEVVAIGILSILMIAGLIMFVVGDPKKVVNYLDGAEAPPTKVGASLFDKICGFVSY